MQIQDSIAFVTGANRGVGKVFTDALLARGATTVYAAARNPETITDPRLTPVRLDVTDPESVAAAAVLAADATLVVNNAGISIPGSALTSPDVAEVRRQFETNLFGVLHVTRSFAPVLGRNGGGALVNMLSALSWATTPQLNGYSASKAAAWSLTNATRGELQSQGTQVVGVHVGYIDTDMSADVDAPKVTPASVVEQVLDALEAGAVEVLADELTGHVKAGLSGTPEALFF